MRTSASAGCSKECPRNALAEGSVLAQVASIVGAMAFLAACGDGPNRSRQDSMELSAAPTVDTQPQPVSEITVTGPQSLRCDPGTFSSDDTLTLAMNAPHGAFLAVIAPGGRWFYLIHTFGGFPGYSPSVIPPQSFQVMPVYRIPASVRARPAIYGRDSLEAVFDRPGEYRIVLAEKLGTDYGPPPVECVVDYRGKE